MTTPKLCPETIKACIEALPRTHDMARTEAWQNGFDWHVSQSRAALNALLPKDRAETLVDLWCMGSNFTGDRAVLQPYTRWLLSPGYLKESEG